MDNIIERLKATSNIGDAERIAYAYLREEDYAYIPYVEDVLDLLEQAGYTEEEYEEHLLATL